MSSDVLGTNIEKTPAPGELLVSATDLSSNITFANDAFVRISGYSREELIGKPHKLTRHPDMPGPVFAHLWKTLQRGRPWRGAVKNRCKNGDFYWCDAYIVPQKERGQTVGYMSVRTGLTPEQIRRAEARYKEIARTGKIDKTGGLMRFFSIKRSVLAGIAFCLLATAIGAGIGVTGLQSTAYLVSEVEHYRDVGVMIASNNQFANRAQTSILLAMQHGPDGGHHEFQDKQGLGNHLRQLSEAATQMEGLERTIAAEKNVSPTNYARLDSILGGYEQRRAANHVAVDRYVKASHRLLSEGIYPVIELLSASKFHEAHQYTISKIAPLTAAMNADAETAGRAIGDSAEDLKRAVDELYREKLVILVVWAVFTFLMISVAGILFFRQTMRPLRKALSHVNRIAEGDLSRRLDVFGFGEPGKVVSAVAIMQVKLKVMLDEIQTASAAVRDQVKRLNDTTIAVVNCTEDQYQQALQINAALEDSGADVQRLTECAANAFAQAQKIAATPASASTDDIQTLLRLANETASLANLNGFAATEIQRLSTKIISLVAENRESANDAWTIGQRLDSTSKDLDAMLEKFT